VSDADELQPDAVVLEVAERQVAYADVFVVADVVLDPCATAVITLDVSDRAALVGEDRLEAMPVGIGEGQLRAGMRALAAGGAKPGRRRPVSLPWEPRNRAEGAIVNSWDLRALDLKPRLPEILSSSDAARAIVLELAAGESLSDHQVHERAWLVVLDGEVQVTTAEGGHTSGGVGLLVELAPGERHEVLASADARLLLLLTPWPGSGHPGAMTIREKLYARRHAAKQAE